MNITTYYGMDYNPFTKSISSGSLYESNDLRQMKNRLEFLIDTHGIGLFTGESGIGKTTALRSVLSDLDPARYKVVYVCLTTITPLDFYISLNDALGLEESRRKSKLFDQIKGEIENLNRSHINVIIAVDEAQFLSRAILKEFIMLMNFSFDSRDCCTLILMGQSTIEGSLRAKALEPFRQRINMHYTLTGFTQDEVTAYIKDRLKLVKCRSSLFTDEAYHTLFSLMSGSVRILNSLINKSLIIGMHREQQQIDSQIIMEANEEARL